MPCRNRTANSIVLPIPTRLPEQTPGRIPTRTAIRIGRRVGFLSLLCSLLFGTAAAQPTTADTAGVRGAVEEFWKAFGEMNPQQVKRLLSFPCVVMEIPDAESGRPAKHGLFATAKEFDAEWKRSAGSGKKKHGDFYGATLSNFVITFSGPHVAQATYTFTLPNTTLQPLQLLAVLVRNGPAAAWQFVVISIPK